jgi:hypothetical protein
MKWFVIASVLVLGLPSLAHGQNSPAAQAAQPGNPADPAMQVPAAQALPSDEPGSAPAARDPSSAAALSSDPDPEASSEARNSGTRLASALPPGISAAQACTGFKSDVQCATALHAAQNLNIPFADLKARLLDGAKLASAIHTLKPTADASSEVRRAEEQARGDRADRPPAG